MNGTWMVFDWDNTLSADPAMWGEVVRIMKARGYRVMCMTQRHESEEAVDDIEAVMEEHGMMMILYFTNGASKTWSLSNLQIDKYILIDDDPRSAVYGK